MSFDCKTSYRLRFPFSWGELLATKCTRTGVCAKTLLSSAPLAPFLLLLLKSSQVEAIVLTAPVVLRFSANTLIALAGMALIGLLNSIFMVGSFQALGTPLNCSTASSVGSVSASRSSQLPTTYILSQTT